MDLSEAAQCGLYCGLCASRCRLPHMSRSLRDALRLEAYDLWAPLTDGLREGFPAFWHELERLAGQPCPGCRAGGGYSECPIRPCARERGATVCPTCSD